MNEYWAGWGFEVLSDEETSAILANYSVIYSSDAWKGIWDLCVSKMLFG